MNPIEIDGYLTQKKLSNALKQITGPAWLGDEIKVPGSRHRWDMAFKVKSTICVVEYDGDEHYRNTLKIKSDTYKDSIANDNGFLVVRFPYWIQLNNLTISHFFNLTGNIIQDFPHGFITTKIFPASFCELGVERFFRQLMEIPNTVEDDVIKSLKDRSDEHGIEYVLPSSLRYILNS
jgi:hypothetical protein